MAMPSRGSAWCWSIRTNAGRGLGTSLLDAGVAMLDDMPLVRLDATPAGYAIYIKREFREEYRLQRMRSVVPDGIEPPAVSRVRPMTTDDLDEVIAFDEEVFGARRAAMLRWMWEGAPEYAWAALADGRLAGYTFGRHGYAFEHLGPIVAGTPTTALLLARAAMARHPGREFVVDAGEHSAEWLRGLQRLGFQPLRPLIRMARGRTPGHRAIRPASSPSSGRSSARDCRARTSTTETQRTQRHTETELGSRRMHPRAGVHPTAAKFVLCASPCPLCLCG